MDDSGHGSKDPREVDSKPDPSGEDLQLYLEESWGAIDDLKKSENRMRRIKGLVTVGLTLTVIAVLVWLALTYVEFRDPVDAANSGIVAWLVVPSEDSGDFKFFPGEQATASVEGGALTKLGAELLPVLPLKVHDEVSVQAGAQAVLFIPEAELRQEYEGPCNLTVLAEGPQVTAGEGQLINSVPITDWLRGQKRAGGGIAPSAEDTEAGRPTLIYPVGCSSYLGILDLEWEYGGDAENVVVGVRTRAGELLRETEIEAGVSRLGINLEGGKGYRWDVTAGKVTSAAGEFRVISDAEREWIATAARACGMEGEDIIGEATAGSNVYRLSALYTILISNNLTREADAVLGRLKPLGGAD